MERQKIFERLKQVLAVVLRNSVADAESVTPETKLYDELGMESLDMIDLIMSAEVNLNVSLDMADAKNVQTVNDLIDMVEPLLKDRP